MHCLVLIKTKSIRQIKKNLNDVRQSNANKRQRILEKYLAIRKL